MAGGGIGERDIEGTGISDSLVYSLRVWQIKTLYLNDGQRLKAINAENDVRTSVALTNSLDTLCLRHDAIFITEEIVLSEIVFVFPASGLDCRKHYFGFSVFLAWIGID